MRYLIVQGDGMADHPLEELSGKTPLEAASTPYMDLIASTGSLGTVRTIPPGLPPGSSVGNMSLMGLDPEKYFTGRAPLEAKALGIPLGAEDIAFRCNLVNLSKNGRGEVMEDYSGGRPSSDQAGDCIELLDRKLGDEEFRFYQGVSYRNLLVWKNGRKQVDREGIHLTPPHDISGEPVDNYRPRGEGGEKLDDLQERAKQALRARPCIANGIWLWGQGIRPEVPTIQERYNLEGSVISAVDLIKGLGAYAGLKPVEVKGATGFIDTNYMGKVSAAVENLRENSIVFLHVEAPDEASHEGDIELKLRAIEKIDELVLSPIVDYLSTEEGSRIMLVTDHITGIESRTHERGAVPFAISELSEIKERESVDFTEREASRTGVEFDSGSALMKSFIHGEVD